MTLAELNRKAFKTLVETLGYVNAVRFFKQFDTKVQGQNYSSESYKPIRIGI